MFRRTLFPVPVSDLCAGTSLINVTSADGIQSYTPHVVTGLGKSCMPTKGKNPIYEYHPETRLILGWLLAFQFRLSLDSYKFVLIKSCDPLY